MKTIEEIKGQKVWAVDAAYYWSCERCIFKDKDECKNLSCFSIARTDNRNVIFQTYEEEEKTFTLLQINEMLFDFINYYIDLHGIDKRFQLENITIVDEFLKQKIQQL